MPPVIDINVPATKPAFSRVHDILRQCREHYPDMKSICGILGCRCNIERRAELTRTSQLFNTLLFLDDDLPLVLRVEIELYQREFRDYLACSFRW